MLGRCYRAELSKILKGKGIYIALAIMICFITMISLFALFFDDVISIPGFGGNDVLDTLKNIDRSEYGARAEQMEQELNRLESENSTLWSRFVDVKGQMRMYIATLRYLDAHPEVELSDVVMPSTNAFSASEGSFNFMYLVITFLTELIIFYAVITMTNIYAGEYKDGTLRLELLRPNTRATVLTSKWLATMTMSVLLFIVGVIYAAIFAAFHFKFDSKSVLCVINNAQVFVMNEHLFLFVLMLCSFISVFAMVMFSSFMATITKFNRAASMAVPIVVILIGGISSYLLQVVYLGILDFSYNLSLAAFLTPAMSALPGSSLYTAIPILLAYIALFTSISYVKFNKAEL